MNRWRRGLLVGSAIGLFGVVFALTPAYLSLETRWGLYTLFHLRGERPPPSDVAIVAIDGRSGEKLGLPELPREWPRSIHGQLVDQLVQRGAAAIVFDMDFRRPRDDDQDLALAQAITAANRVVLFEHLNGRRQPIEDREGRHSGSVWVEELEAPMPVLATAAKALAPFPLPKVDAAVDQFWTFKASARDLPTMPAAALQIYALRDYEHWRALLAASTQQSIGGLPLKATDIRDASQMQTLMLGTRRLFEQEPELAARMAKSPALSQATDQSGRTIRALLGLYAGDNGRYLNYYGPPGTINTVPYPAVIKGEDPNFSAKALDFTGKVVFVGYSDLYDPGQPDRFYTSFTRGDGVDLSGVEIAATAFANLLTDRSVQPLRPGTALLVLLMFGMVIGALLYLTPAVLGVTLAFSLAALYALGAQLSFNTAGFWWPLATPLLTQLPLALFVGLFAQYRLEHKRVKHISEAIRYYVPEDVSRVLTATGVGPDSVNKVTYGTCLATDMAGFSTIAEKMKPGDLARFLNEYFEALAQALKRHHVTVTEFRADAIMCAWTGAADDATVRSRPVQAALEAARVIGEFNQDRNLAGNLRIGLTDGEFYVGHAGGGGRFAYSIVGDCANTASRIEGLNKHLGTQILTTRTVVEGQDDLLVRYLGKYRFAGKTGSLPITEVVATQASATAPQLDLCSRFATAQVTFEQDDWAPAAEHFEHLLRDYPNDTPTRFLLNRCRSYLSAETTPDEPGVITMTAK